MNIPTTATMIKTKIIQKITPKNVNIDYSFYKNIRAYNNCKLFNNYMAPKYAILISIIKIIPDNIHSNNVFITFANIIIIMNKIVNSVNI